MKETIVRKIEKEEAISLKEKYQKWALPSSQYVFFAAETPSLRLTIYENAKGEVTKAVYLYKNARETDKNKKKIFSSFPQIGSDEVGTGDFIGPLVVSASYLEKKDLKLLKELKITDSKKMSDDYILEIGPTLLKSFQHVTLVLTPKKYNEISSQYNMNAIKAIMHNHAFCLLKKKHPQAQCYLDQFVEPKTYYHYLKESEEIIDEIVFHTKGELYFPSVALGSCLARYRFLLEHQSLEGKYGPLPKGAGPIVDKWLEDFLNNHDEGILKELVKLNFKNFKKLEEKPEH